MNKKIILGIVMSALFLQALQASAASTAYQYNGKYYYIVDGNNPNMNSGDRVCASMGQTCVGYTANTTNICKFIHPTASVTTTVNGNSNGFYCNGSPQGYAACSTAINNCQICPACGTISCSDQIGDQYAQMYVECSGKPTADTTVISVSATPTQQTTTHNNSGWLNGFLNYLHSLWLSLGWITPSGTPTGTNHTANHATTPPQGTLLPAQICQNGGQCKSGNCVRDDQGVYRCSCSNLGSDYSSCH